jgi:hypothetical protein
MNDLAGLPLGLCLGSLGVARGFRIAAVKAFEFLTGNTTCSVRHLLFLAEAKSPKRAQNHL